MFYGVPRVPQSLFILLLLLRLYNFNRSICTILIDLSSSLLVLFSASLNLRLNPPSKFFILVIVLLCSRISVQLLYIISPYWYPLFAENIILLIFDSSLFMDSFSSLRVFKTVDLKSLSSKSNVWASSGTVSANFFLFLWMRYIFLGLCMLLNLLLGTGHFQYLII